MTDPARRRVSVDAGRLWGGGVATGLVAALVAVVGVLVCSIVDVRLVRPAFLLDFFHTFAGDYALTAFVLTLVATGVAHLMALVTPRPRMFFSWIVGLATVAGVAFRSRWAKAPRARSPLLASTWRWGCVSCPCSGA